MTAQIDYVCWDPAVVATTIPTEAATPSDEVLLATHAPLRIHRRGSKGGHAADEVIDEHQVLNDFLTNPATNGVLVAAVLGESGTGKSHLVRWMKAKIPSAPRRHIIYLKKTDTSLKNVVEALLAGQTGAEFDDIRSRINTLGNGVTLDVMESRILDGIAEALTTQEAKTSTQKALVGPNGLALFFRDPLFRDHLLRPGSFIKRRAKHALHGRDPDEPDIPLEFTIDELPINIVDHADIRDAAASTRRIFQRLVGLPPLQVEAVTLLNAILDLAVTRAASLGVGDLAQAFLRVRENLVGDEIVLLIEDVALIQGVRRDLLDAITDPGIVQGQERYATIRTMLAVTSGYYYESLPETFRYRAEATAPQYIVDVDLASQAADDYLFIDFMGRYLNAARVGREDLEQNAPLIPNACATCQFQPTCHETFGDSRDGYGLYPFNRSAIMRAVRTYADMTNDRRTFNPRRVLSRAIRDGLIDSVAVIEAGDFPTAHFLSGGPGERGLPTLPLDVRAKIEDRYADSEAERVTKLLTVWADAGRIPLPPRLLTAFGHEQLPDDLVESGGVQPPHVDDDGQRKGRAVPTSVTRDLEAINKWSARQANLPPALAREFRATIRKALLARIDWFDVVIKEPDSATINGALPNNVRTISIEGSNENIKNPNSVLQVPQNAKMGEMLSGLKLLTAGVGSQANDALPRLDAIVEPALTAARQRIVEHLEVGDDELVEAAASLLRGARDCGRPLQNPNEVDLLNTVCWAEEHVTVRTDEQDRHASWMAGYRSYVESRPAVVQHLLAGAGTAQGARGAVNVIDAERLIPLLKRAWDLTTSGMPLTLPRWCTTSERRAEALRTMARTQTEHWARLIHRIRRHLPPDDSYLETVDAISEATKAGAGFALVLVTNLADLPRINQDARGLRASDIADVERRLDLISAARDREIPELVGVPAGGFLERIADYLDYSSGWISAGLNRAAAEGGTVADLDNDLDQISQRWTAAVRDIQPRHNTTPGAQTTDPATQQKQTDDA